MRIIPAFLISLALIANISCTDSGSKAKVTPGYTPPPAGSQADAGPATPMMNPGMQAVSTPAPAPAPAPGNQQTATAPGMNPPHGQPGHRCEIPVGAPLNSAPGKTAAAPATPQPQPQVNISPQPVAPQPQQKTPTAPGMNPPHGEPGHRCEIPVGSPLNSPPANNPNPGTSPSPTISIEPGNTGTTQPPK